jgi:hypothetical protein
VRAYFLPETSESERKQVLSRLASAEYTDREWGSIDIPLNGPTSAGAASIVTYVSRSQKCPRV